MTEEANPQVEDFKPRVRWCNPQRLDLMTFVGKDVFAIAHDLYIIFFNYKTNTETVYIANSEKKGDGVDALAGHRTHMFAFAEKAQNARIFVVMYPSFEIMVELKEPNTKRFKAVSMMESDLIAGLTGFPTYLLTVWCWRTHQRLYRIETGVTVRTQLFMASRTHMLVAQCWGSGLNVWEVARCYNKCFLLKRPRESVIIWESSESVLTGICWSLEGQLYVIDNKGDLYSMSSDGIKLNKVLEWSDEEIEGKRPTSVCSFLSGVLIYGPDENLRYLRKQPEGKTWRVEWTYIPEDEVARLVSNSYCDMATMWTNTGFVYKIAGDQEEKIEVTLFTLKQRNIMKIQLIAPDFKYIALMNTSGILSIYNVFDQKLILMKIVKGYDVSFQASPVDPVLAVFGEVNGNYGVVLRFFTPDPPGLTRKDHMCLTHQIVSLVNFAPDGKYLVAAAMSAGHIFVFQVSEAFKLILTRYMEVGRGLADCFLMKIGPNMRCFSLVLFSEKFNIGERIVCINAETGKDNKFAGKMQGPYTRLLPLSTKDTVLAIPHLSRMMHILKLNGDKGVTVSVKMGPIIESGHEIKQFDGFRNVHALLTFGFDGSAILRAPDGPEEYLKKLTVTHRYEHGIKSAMVDEPRRYVLNLAANGTLACVFLKKSNHPPEDLVHQPPDKNIYHYDEHADINTINIINHNDKNYLQLQEDKMILEETRFYRLQLKEVVKMFESLKAKLVALLEENINEVPLHQLSLSEFNLHQEARKERLKAAEKEREEIRLDTEARIRAQDKVTAWIKKTCWDNMRSQRIKLFAIFSHYHVESFPILPSHREVWPELQQVEALRTIEKDNDKDLFRPWLVKSVDENQSDADDAGLVRITSFNNPKSPSTESIHDSRRVSITMTAGDDEESATKIVAEPHVLSGSSAHHFVTIPKYMIPQLEAYSFLQMNWLHHIVQLNTQNMRLWFNKQFNDLFVLKKREVGLVSERNNRLRFIIEELNKLSDLRGSFHHLTIQIQNPQWRQEEYVENLIKVEPEECSIEPYISPSQIVIIPPDPGPKDDFRERALMDMMDGVLEKLWHEEIKKPIPKPLCMLEKDPENFNEEDLRHVFDYEKKVAFRNEERDKYRKMLHAEYAKLSQVLNEGILKFNQKVRDTWLLKIKVDSTIGQENLNLMRLRRVNLDRIVMAEKIEEMRDDIALYEQQVEDLNAEFTEIQAESVECQGAYDALSAKDRQLDRTFKNHFTDLSPIIIEQAYKFFKKRPKWHQRVTMTPVVLYELANAVATGVRPPLLHYDCVEYYKGVDQLDQISNMPTVLDEHLWTTVCKLRRIKIENEIRMRALVQDLAYVEHANGVWLKAIQARRSYLATCQSNILQHRVVVELAARNKTVQLVLPAGQVEIITTGHMQDFEDAALIPREAIEKINNLILRVGEMKLRMMRKQMEFRKGILSKEWEHSQMKMKLRHMKEELISYRKLKIPKELQRFLKNKEQGYTDEQDFVLVEKDNEASKASAEKTLNDQMNRCGVLEVKLLNVEAAEKKLDKFLMALKVKVSDKKLKEDPLEPIRLRRMYIKRMEILVKRSRLIREVQANHSTIVMLQTELELLRLKTYPTLASFTTY